MKAMVLEAVGSPLRSVKLQRPEPGDGEVRIRIEACAVCRTDLHVVDGDLEEPSLPLVPGHQIAGVVDAVGSRVESLSLGDRVGVPWLGWTCGECRFCVSERENLCERARFTGYDINGGFAQYAVADARYCFALPTGYSAEEASPLLCAGLIGFRSLGMCDDAKRIGFYGFGSAAHVISQIATAEGREVFAFTREGDRDGQAFALELGAIWAGSSVDAPPEPLDAAIIFAPVGNLVPVALHAVDRGGRVVCAGIHMSDIPAFSYSLLWEERAICSVANLTRADAREFFEVVSRIRIESRITSYPLEKANEALGDLRHGRINGTAVLKID